MMIPVTLPLIASALAGLALASAAGLIVRQVLAPRTDASLDLFEISRRKRLREWFPLYRWFEPVFDAWCPHISDLSPATVQKLSSDMTILRDYPPWAPSELICKWALEGGTAGLLLATVVATRGYHWQAAILLIAVPGVWMALQAAGIRESAALRQSQIRARLPYALDLIAMMLSAGLGLQRSIERVVAVSPSHPLSVELACLLQDMELGTTEKDAFKAFGARFGDDALREFSAAVVQGFELGMPIATIFRTQGEQMRVIRSQLIEKAVAEAEVKMTGPGLAIGVLCMVLMLLPFGLKLAQEFWN